MYLSKGDREAAESALAEAEQIDPQAREKFGVREENFVEQGQCPRAPPTALPIPVLALQPPPQNNRIGFILLTTLVSRKLLRRTGHKLGR